MAWTLGLAIDFASGLSFSLLGAWILTLRPRRSGNVAFAAFLISFGAFWMAKNLDGAYAHPVLQALDATFGVTTAVALALGLRHIPQRVHRRERWALLVPFALLLLLVIYIVVSQFAFWQDEFGTRLAMAEWIAFLTLGYTLATAGIIWGLRYRSAPAYGRREYAILTSALLLYGSFITAAWFAEVVQARHAYAGFWWLDALIAAAYVVLPTLLWLWNVITRPDKRLARNTLIVTATASTLGILLTTAGVTQDGPPGVLRLLSTLFLVVAVLRGQFLDVDTKMRWTINRGALAAIFVAVFFVVGEGAQELLTPQMGPWLGILAAGLLVFALAPLQRLTERVGDALVPGGRPVATLGSSERIEIYRNQLRTAWTDGSLSIDERRLLEGLRGQLGISTEEATRIESEWLGEAGRHA